MPRPTFLGQIDASHHGTVLDDAARRPRQERQPEPPPPPPPAKATPPRRAARSRSAATRPAPAPAPAPPPTIPEGSLLLSPEEVRALDHLLDSHPATTRTSQSPKESRRDRI